MAAGVDFGDSELFQQLDEGEGPPPLPPRLSLEEEEEEEEKEEEEQEKEEEEELEEEKEEEYEEEYEEKEEEEAEEEAAERPDKALEDLYERLRNREETVRRLRAENQELKRKLNILTRPSGIYVENSKLDGPLLQILFMNNVISRQYHQEIEDFIFGLVQKYEEQRKSEQEKTQLTVKPQPSSILLEEDGKTASSSSKKVKEAFSVVGSVLYFTNFCLDKLGQPILNENPQLTEGWEIPKYQQVFSHILSLDGQDIQVKPKRPKPTCFNCGSEDHQMKDCPKPRNAARISEKRKEYMEACGESSNQIFQQRYHAEEVEERFGKFKPGVISGELQDALGVTDKSLPPFIYRMRQLGYPPGWLKEAEMEHSGLTLYDGKGSSGADEESHQPKRTTYDVSKLINYPGFNISTPSGIPDEWQLFGSIPMQPSQQKEVFAQYLSSFHAPSPKSNNKRPASESRSRHSKQPKDDNLEAPVTDMEIDSDLEMSQRSQTPSSSQFQPPLPPGRPLMSTPPPLPQGTPPQNLTPPQPSTPTRHPLPRTASPSNPSSDTPEPKIVDAVMDEDTLTLEELEEQQRLIWAALEQAESTNSDSDIQVDTPLAGNSVTSSPSRNEADLVAEVRSPEKVVSVETRLSDTSEQLPESEHSMTSPNPGDSSLTSKEDPANTDSEGLLDNTSPAPNPEVEEGENTSDDKAVKSTAKNCSIVPDMSKFAAGITPFEFENLAESTGVYLRIRSVLKNSPRNQQRKKTSS
ncbi:zinc finger CCHC domain-containing protein 8 isoform X2 [Strigops habroptila]|uniref:zinc finger CCHC domain-containing protein 8 isoform X2 n=1 Tax=Strigops habroptila TaxID=2489341 RepID=UPI0011CEF3AC|nr:zinc finger CCHC domain-containing protein 8 isoform X2 [Strigops habroptila]